MDYLIFPKSQSNNYPSLLRELLIKNGNSALECNAKTILIQTLVNKIKGNKTCIILNWIDGYPFKNGRLSYLRLFALVNFILACRVLSNKLLFIRHDIYPHIYKDDVWTKFLYKFLNSHAKGLAHVPNLRLDGINYDYIPRPLDYKLFNKRKENSKEDSVVFFGRLMKYKNLDYLCSSWIRYDIKAKLIIAGIPWDKEYIREIKNKFMLYDNIEIIDKYLNDEEIREIYSRARAAILPHMKESMIGSASFYQALYYHIPIIATNNIYIEYTKKYNYLVQILDKDFRNLEEIIKRTLEIPPERILQDINEFRKEHSEKTIYFKIQQLT